MTLASALALVAGSTVKLIPNGGNGVTLRTGTVVQPLQPGAGSVLVKWTDVTGTPYTEFNFYVNLT